MQKKIWAYFSLIKVNHTIFSLPFAVISFFLIQEKKNISFSFQTLVFVLLCLFFARSAAMAYNRFLDAKIDAKNSRTKEREIPSGKIERSSVGFLVVLNSFLFALCSYWINPSCLYLSPIALIIILGYSYTKRFTPWSHIVLGLSLALAPIGAGIAVSESFDITILFLGLAVTFWVAGFDIIYSLQDEKFDIANNLHSIPVKYGYKKSLQIARVFHIFTILSLVTANLLYTNGYFSFIGISLFGYFLVRQHLVIRKHGLERINLAFFVFNGVGSVLLCLLWVLDILFL